MAENVYEGMLILDSNRYARDAETVSGQIAKFVEQAGGKVLTGRLWEERRLAYHIKGHRKGTYWLTYFRLDGKDLTGVERKCRLSDSILRALFLKVDPRIVDTLITHAQAGTDKPTSKTVAASVATATDDGKVKVMEDSDKTSQKGLEAASSKQEQQDGSE